MATLTGAARTALGPDLPALFGTDDAACAELLAAGADSADPLWRLPLWQPYRKLLDSRIADINNAPDSPFAGAHHRRALSPGIRRADGAVAPYRQLRLERQPPPPGRPEGGEALGLRALYG